MDKNRFSYHLTKYFSEYLPKQTAASPNTIRSYRDTFVQLMEFYKTEYRLPPEKLEYKEFNAERIESFLVYLEEVRKVSISTRNQRLAAIHAFFRYLQYRDPAGFEQCARILAVPFKKAPVKPGTVCHGAHPLCVFASLYGAARTRVNSFREKNPVFCFVLIS